MLLLSEILINVVDFVADCSFNFVRGAPVLQVAVSGGAAGFFFHGAFGLLDAALYFIFGAGFHAQYSRASEFWDAFARQREKSEVRSTKFETISKAPKEE